MKLKKLILGLALGLMVLPSARADKGMWLLNELKKENIQRMKELGFKLDPQKLFNMDAPGIANAVVIFGGGCTGITVSNEGLVFTNHHCGYSSIQSQSTVKHDYLRDGFVSHKYSEELPIPGLSVRYLREVINVTDRVVALEHQYKNEMELMTAQQNLMDQLLERYMAKHNNESIDAQVYAFYERNKFYLIVYDVFEDVRLAFTPPNSVGKFGHDSDNWMWPRHTNDFSVFRVYANQNNEPAKYSKDNKPYHPRYAAKISLAGVKEGDYAMTIGFPGSTDRYLSSWGVKQRIENENEPRILVRGLKQDMWMKYMKADQATNIMYSSKYAGSSNYWKNSIGMNRGLKRLNVIENKKQIEKEFAEWVSKDPKRQAKYGAVLDSLRIPMEESGKYYKYYTILMEAFRGTELGALTAMPSSDPTKFDADKLYKDFSPVVGRATLPVMLKVIKDNIPAEYLPSVFERIDNEFGGNYEAYADYVYDNSVVVTRDRMLNALKDYNAFSQAFEKDPAVELAHSFRAPANAISSKIRETLSSYYKGRRLFMQGLQEMHPNEYLPSDANFTMRLSYGTVGGYKPYDNAWYEYFTTQRGIFEKQDPTSYEFAVQPEILDLLKDKHNFGRYADKDGDLHTCFISNNDITGGNSGSPVFNGDGNLIGLAFDGNWEAMSGDIEFEPNLQRTISVDIRYVLFFIDKWGKADNLINELTFVK